MKRVGCNTLSPDQDHISVCICTFKRPRMLERLLKTLFNQVTEKTFAFSIVVVDNDPARSAESVVSSIKEESPIALDYDHEPEPNIANARNRSIRHAQGNLIAFIDDDEFPEECWLLNLYKSLKRYDVDGILGPVKPHFEQKPSQWIERGKLCERSEFITGTVVRDSRYTRTGNVLIKRLVLDDEEGPFDPSYGKSGGSDGDLFKKLIEHGHIFMWCNEAVVFETVPLERQQRRYFLKRAFTRGMTTTRHIPFFNFSTVKSIFAIAAYTLALPFLFVVSHHLFMKYLIKDCDHLGKMLAYFGINFVKERPY